MMKTNSLLPSGRDPIAALIRYNRQFVGDGRDPAWLRAKLDRLCASPFGFLRGTFHLFVQDWPSIGIDALPDAPLQPIVGDLHLENFGAYRAAGGRVVFDVNDFDETGEGVAALDLARVATSIVLADERHTEARAVERVVRLLDSWREAVTQGDISAVNGHDAPAILRQLIDAADEGTRGLWLDKRVEAVDGVRRFRPSDKYQRISDPMLRVAIVEGLREFGRDCPDRPAEVSDWPHVLDVAVRIAGTGSLGRFRWAALVESKSGRVGKERILELKEALPSSLAPDDPSDPAAKVVTQQRRLQGASPAFLGTAQIGGRSFSIRELQPTEAKIEVAAFKPSDVDALCAACGMVLGRLHRRADPELATRLVGIDRKLTRAVASFALRYAEIVVHDHARLRAQRAEVEHQLGLSR